MPHILFIVFRYIEPWIIEIVLGSLMSFYPRLFSSVFFREINEFTDIAMIFLGFMTLAFGIIHIGLFSFLTRENTSKEIQEFQLKGIATLLKFLFIGDIVHLLILGVRVYYGSFGKILVPQYYSQFLFPILLMVGRWYALKNMREIFGFAGKLAKE